MSLMNHKKKAFTLIELLVVIAIIAILAAILFPVFAQAKLAAKKTVALSNAKQVALANLMYMNDNDDHLVKSFFGFPQAPTCDWGSISGNFHNWRWALYPYSKSTGLLGDPTNPFSSQQFWTQADGGGGDPNTNLPSNFAVNTALIGFADGACAGLGNKDGLDTLDSVGDVAGTIIMVPSRTQWNDMPWDWGTYYGALGGPTAGNPYGDPSDPGGHTNTTWCITAIGASSATCPAAGNGPIHAVGKQSTFVWADGHAKSKAYNATLRVTDPTGDDWASSLEINDLTNAFTTQTDRQAAVAAGFFPEYQ